MELLVSITLMGLVTVAIHSGFRLTLSSWEKSEKVLQRQTNPSLRPRLDQSAGQLNRSLLFAATTGRDASRRPVVSRHNARNPLRLFILIRGTLGGRTSAGGIFSGGFA